MRKANLERQGFEHIVVYEDGRIFDSLRNKFVGIPGDHRITCFAANGVTKLNTSRGKLVRSRFLAPWRNGIECKNLAFLGASRYFATVEGKIFGTRNMDYLTPRYTPDGYQMVALYMDNGDYMPWRVSRLIAMAFVPNPENKDTVDHINSVRDDNRAENLRWMWMWENIDHRRHASGKGPTDDKIREICKCLESGMSQTETADACDVDRRIIKGIQDGQYYRITKDYKIPMVSQRRVPAVFRLGAIKSHGQMNRRHPIVIDPS